MNSKNLDMTTPDTSKPVYGYSRFAFVGNDKEQLLKKFVPKYQRVLADHATHDFRVTHDSFIEDDRAESDKPILMKFYGYLDSGDGLECFLVNVDGSNKRPDGKLYHVTWSLQPDVYKPVDSNALIQQQQYSSIRPVSVSMNFIWNKF